MACASFLMSTIIMPLKQGISSAMYWEVLRPKELQWTSAGTKEWPLRKELFSINTAHVFTGLLLNWAWVRWRSKLSLGSLPLEKEHKGGIGAGQKKPFHSFEKWFLGVRFDVAGCCRIRMTTRLAVGGTHLFSGSWCLKLKPCQIQWSDRENYNTSILFGGTRESHKRVSQNGELSFPSVRLESKFSSAPFASQMHRLPCPTPW